ncbi:MAG: hypothetical protein WA160_14810 [Pseudobdellovibrio sp.]
MRFFAHKTTENFGMLILLTALIISSQGCSKGQNNQSAVDTLSSSTSPVKNSIIPTIRNPATTPAPSTTKSPVSSTNSSSATANFGAKCSPNGVNGINGITYAVAQVECNKCIPVNNNPRVCLWGTQIFGQIGAAPKDWMDRVKLEVGTVSGGVVGPTAGVATESEITNAYQTLLMRQPDAVGLKYWIDKKVPLKDIVDNFIWVRKNELIDLYKRILNRAPTAAELESKFSLISIEASLKGSVNPAPNPAPTATSGWSAENKKTYIAAVTAYRANQVIFKPYQHDLTTKGTPIPATVLATARAVTSALGAASNTVPQALFMTVETRAKIKLKEAIRVRDAARVPSLQTITIDYENRARNKAFKGYPVFLAAYATYHVLALETQAIVAAGKKVPDALLAKGGAAWSTMHVAYAEVPKTVQDEALLADYWAGIYAKDEFIRTAPEGQEPLDINEFIRDELLIEARK